MAVGFWRRRRERASVRPPSLSPSPSRRHTGARAELLPFGSAPVSAGRDGGRRRREKVGSGRMVGGGGGEEERERERLGQNIKYVRTVLMVFSLLIGQRERERGKEKWEMDGWVCEKNMWFLGKTGFGSDLSPKKHALWGPGQIYLISRYPLLLADIPLYVIQQKNNVSFSCT